MRHFDGRVVSVTAVTAVLLRLRRRLPNLPGIDGLAPSGKQLTKLQLGQQQTQAHVTARRSAIVKLTIHITPLASSFLQVVSSDPFSLQQLRQIFVTMFRFALMNAAILALMSLVAAQTAAPTPPAFSVFPFPVLLNETAAWSTARLSVARGWLAATSLPIQGLAIFAGGALTSVLFECYFRGCNCCCTHMEGIMY